MNRSQKAIGMKLRHNYYPYSLRVLFLIFTFSLSAVSISACSSNDDPSVVDNSIDEKTDSPPKILQNSNTDPHESFATDPENRYKHDIAEKTVSDVHSQWAVKISKYIPLEEATISYCNDHGCMIRDKRDENGTHVWMSIDSKGKVTNVDTMTERE